jgi:type II secretory ATPase GspE/PulE/Tfp pilus assembly ATPase PilB-like protein
MSAEEKAGPEQSVPAEAIDWQEAVALKLSDLEPERAASLLLEYAATLPASDVFLSSDEKAVRVAVRYLGFPKVVASLPRDDGRRLMNHIKALAGMDISPRLRPEDGRWVHELASGHIMDLRINAIPTLYGEDMAIRLLDREMRLLRLDILGLARQDLSKLRSMLASPGGLVLVTGPTGSGKTTTLYACVQYLNDGTRKINTIEDPVEYALEGVRQSQVNPRMDLDFPELLRSVLRQAPDVIMVGEIRDPITAETAVRAANSGHLVFATLHAPTAPGAVDSMLAMGVHPHFLASSLLGILAQRLVRTLCPKCKLGVDISESPLTFEDVRKWLEPSQGQAIYAAHGCPECRQEGFTGRTGIFEVLRVSKEVRRLVAERRTVREIREQAIKEGMLDVRRAALLKVAEGVTSTEEMMRVIPAEQLMPAGEE